jgi:hypothetical protein
MDMLKNHFTWWPLVLSGSVLACGSGQAGTTGATSESNGLAAPLAACASLDQTDAAGGQCIAARAYLNCQEPGGVVQACTSDNGVQCAAGSTVAAGGSSNPMVADASLSCVNQCNSNEYVVECGGATPGPTPQLPSGCRSLPAGFGGGVVGCCPCGS